MAAQINIGDSAKDNITGYSGVVIARATYQFGCSRLTIQAKKTDADGAPLGAQTFDDQRVKLVKRAEKKIPAPKWKFEFGDVVKDTTGFKGKVSAREESLSGVSIYEVQPQGLKENGEMLPSYWIPEHRLSLIRSEAPVIEKTTASRTGGPQAPRRSIPSKRV